MFPAKREHLSVIIFGWIACRICVLSHQPILSLLLPVYKAEIFISPHRMGVDGSPSTMHLPACQVRGITCEWAPCCLSLVTCDLCWALYGSIYLLIFPHQGKNQHIRLLFTLRNEANQLKKPTKILNFPPSPPSCKLKQTFVPIA